MAKHVCPVCETVHAEKGFLQIEVMNQPLQYEFWKCPSCGYRFVAVADVQDLLDHLMRSAAPQLLARIRDQDTRPRELVRV